MKVAKSHLFSNVKKLKIFSFFYEIATNPIKTQLNSKKN